MRISLQPAFILHSRPWRDTSALLDVLTAEHGRIGVVARGVRRAARRGSSGALLQSFTPLLLSFTGRSELKTLTSVEAAGSASRLSGERLFSALYINELLVRLLHRNDPHPGLFLAYGQAVEALAGDLALDAVLRRFELALLDELGYSFDFATEGHSGQPVEPGERYYFEPGCGLVLWRGGRDQPPLFSGGDLLAIARGEYDGGARLPARRLLREVLAAHLGGAPLRSRELFRSYHARNREPREDKN